jgi:hypothetical protein
MVMSYSVPNDGLDMTQYLDKPGQFHVLIKEVDESPVNQSGEVMSAIRVRGKILAGTDPTQKDRDFSALLSNPNMSHKDGGAFAMKVHLRLARACQIINGQLIPGQQVNLDWSHAKGKQCVIFFAYRKDNDGTERVQVNGAHFYRVDDAEVAAVPKDQAALRMMGVNVATTPQPAPAPVQQAAPAAATQVSGSAWDDV